MVSSPNPRSPGPELVWPGKHAPRPPVEAVRLARVDGWGDGKPPDGQLIEGDNLQVATALLGQLEGKVDLIYIDPPFDSGDDFELGVGATAGSGPAYSDRWEGPGEYLTFLSERLRVCRRLLSERGTIYLHLDYRRVHHARLLLDELFGPKCLRNEIVWHYRSGGRPPQAFAFKHDTLLAYGKTPRAFFDARAAAVPRARANHMKRGQDADGRVYRSVRSAGKVYKYYDDEPVTPDDVWSDISHLHQKDPERTGYPTQKPEKLLERVIRASCPPGGLVVDLFCGSGTTLVVAARLGRRWIGCDVGRAALDTCRRRLLSLREQSPQVSFEILRAEPVSAA